MVSLSLFEAHTYKFGVVLRELTGRAGCISIYPQEQAQALCPGMPEVECIGKGTARQLRKFGVKVSMV
jgi:hypothetical protein